MHRFHIPAPQWNPADLVLPETESHHCVNVLRLGPGDKIVAFNGEGEEATGEITTATKREVRLRALTRATTPPLPVHITLGQAIPKGKNMDLIVEKATELGAAAIAPILSERTVVHLDPEEQPRKRDKWAALTIEAAKQCGRNHLPHVHPPRTLRAFLDDSANAFDLLLIASLQPGARHLRRILADHHETHGAPPRRILALIGPEGDFTPAEISLAQSRGCQPVTLGPIILRTETAALYLLCALSHELLP